MKKVLIADNHTLFRDFLKQKLEEDQIKVILSLTTRELFSKMITNQPSLIIMDMEEENEEEMNFLIKKSTDFNTARIPVIITGEKQDRANIAALAKYGVIKYFAKPIQFDMFFSSIGLTIHAPLSLDTTPCVLDLHRNNNIIFIELALGLNREKIALLKFKLIEMIEKEEIKEPKIILMLTNLDLTFVDGYNLEFLIDSILACKEIENKNIKVLSFSPFVKEFLIGHENYTGIELSTKLPSLLGSLVDTSLTTNVSDLITDKILHSSSDDQNSGSITTRFSTEENTNIKNNNSGSVVNVGIIDSDLGSLALSKKSFEEAGATCFCYKDGKSFYAEFEKRKIDIVVMDIALIDNTGFAVLQFLNKRDDPIPVIIYSKNVQRDVIVRALGAGAKTYLTKPQKPEILVQKSLALLKTNEEQLY